MGDGKLFGDLPLVENDAMSATTKSAVEATFLCLTYDRGHKALLVDVVCDGEKKKQRVKIGLTKGLTALALVTGDRFRCMAKLDEDRLSSPSKFESLGEAENRDQVRAIAEKLYWDQAKDDIGESLDTLLGNLECFEEELSDAWRTRRSDFEQLEDVFGNPPTLFFDDVSECCEQYGRPDLGIKIRGRFDASIKRLENLAEQACDAVIDEDRALTEKLAKEIRDLLKEMKKLCSPKSHDLKAELEQHSSRGVGRVEECLPPPAEPKQHKQAKPTTPAPRKPAPAPAPAPGPRAPAPPAPRAAVSPSPAPRSAAPRPPAAPASSPPRHAAQTINVEVPARKRRQNQRA